VDTVEPSTSPTRAPAAVESPSRTIGDAAFGEVVLAAAIDAATRAPIGEVDSFRSDAMEMHAAVRVQNVKAGAELLFRWTKATQVAAAVVVTVPEDTTDDWVTASVFPNGNLQPGDDWLIAVSFNGAPVGSKTFSVVDAGG
jgi:hypothetical protein